VLNPWPATLARKRAADGIDALLQATTVHLSLPHPVHTYPMIQINEVLTEMRQERERLLAELARAERVIAALEAAAVAAGQPEERVAIVLPDGTTAPAVAKAALPPGIGPYTLLDIYEATARYLSTVDTPKSSTEIAAALRAGGFKTRSKNLVNTVRVMLRRRDGRSTGISVTDDGTRWFVRREPAKEPASKASRRRRTASTPT
jgi:hypothetical protein